MESSTLLGMQTFRPIGSAAKKHATGSIKLGRSLGVAGWNYGGSEICYRLLGMLFKLTS